MQHHNYTCIVASIFLVVAAFHLFRAVFGWTVIINGISVPVYVSWVVVILLGFLTFQGLTLCLKERK